jgi:glycosyltransferase involved in cell wall biosynthesis
MIAEEPRKAMRRRLLLIAATDYDSSRAKGVSDLLSDFDEQGYFDKVVMAFPFTRHERVVKLGPTLAIHEYTVAGPATVRGSRLFKQASAPLHVMRVARAIAALAESEGASVIRATDPCLAGFVGLRAARRAGKPFCVSIHADFDKRHELDPAGGAPKIFGSRRLAVAIERQVMQGADMVLPIRESLIAYAESRGAPRSRIRVIPHGADLSLFATTAGDGAASSLGLPPGARVVSFAGRLSKENYIDDVLAVARVLPAEVGPLVVAIAGSGPEAGRVESIVAADAILRERVRLLGSRPRAEIAALRRLSAVALCPMGGFSLIEACAAGAPAVAYDSEWHRELVIDGRTGYLVPEGDSTGLARAVAALLAAPEAAAAMGRAGQGIALSRHDIAVAVDIKRRCYDELIGAGAFVRGRAA